MSKIVFILILLPSILVTGLLAVPGVVRATQIDRLTTSDINCNDSSDAAPTIADRIARVADEPSSDTANDTAAESTQKMCFDYPDFNSTVGLNLVGDAITFTNKLRLTPALNHKAGAAWYTTSQLIQEGFETTFQFQITNTVFTGADGFAFVIQNSNASALGNHGSGIGYEGITNSLAIEFDTYEDESRDDPNDNHISVQTHGTALNSADYAYSLGSTMTITDISNGGVHTATVEYMNGILWIFLNDLATPILTVPVDLATILDLDDGHAWVGFTAGTSAIWESHDILSWSFCSNIPLVPVQSVIIGGPTTGTVDTAHTFTAIVSPVTATLPITYYWQATDQSPVTHTLGSRTDVITFTWDSPGTQIVIVTATNAGNTDDNRHNIIIRQYIYLPTVMKNGP